MRPARRRAAGILAAALVLAAGCVVAGVWQWQRHEARSTEVRVVTGNYDAAPVPLADLLAGGRLAPADAWRPATAEGRYVGTALLRNRPVAGTPAVHALAVLEVASGPLAGDLLVVDRGWLPAASGIAEVAAPTGTVGVVVRLRPAEPESGRAAPPGQVQRIAPAEVLAAAGDPAGGPLPVYGVLVSEDGTAPTLVEPVPRPDADLGPHLSYAFQWWVFAAGALVGAVVLLRRDTADAATGAERPARAPRGRTGRRPTAEDEEDALLDAAERRAAGAHPTPGPHSDG